MRLQLIRNATLIIEIAGRRLLVDPMLADAESMPPHPDFPHQRHFPLVPLPVAASEVVRDVDAVLITHLHPDHFDQMAAELLPKDLPVICQPWDEEQLRQHGFTQVHPVQEATELLGIEVVRTDGKHGVGLIGQAMGRVSGFILRTPNEPSVYIAGDTIWCGYVWEALETFLPDVVVVNAGAAQFRVGSPITMSTRDIARVCQTAPDATVVAVHMDSVPHALLTRTSLRKELTDNGLLSQVRIPEDGEVLEL